MAFPNGSEKSIVSAQFPRELHEQIVRSAHAHDRSFSAELREAARLYVASQVSPLDQAVDPRHRGPSPGSAVSSAEAAA